MKRSRSKLVIGRPSDCDKGFVLKNAFLPSFRASSCERACGLEHHARVLEHVLDRGAHLVGSPGSSTSTSFAAQPEGSSPTSFTATPSANRPTCSSRTRLLFSGTASSRPRPPARRDDLHRRTNPLDVAAMPEIRRRRLRHEDRVDRLCCGAGSRRRWSLPRDHLRSL